MFCLQDWVQSAENRAGSWPAGLYLRVFSAELLSGLLGKKKTKKQTKLNRANFDWNRQD